MADNDSSLESVVRIFREQHVQLNMDLENRFNGVDNAIQELRMILEAGLRSTPAHALDGPMNFADHLHSVSDSLPPTVKVPHHQSKQHSTGQTSSAGEHFVSLQWQSIDAAADTEPVSPAGTRAPTHVDSQGESRLTPAGSVAKMSLSEGPKGALKADQSGPALGEHSEMGVSTMTHRRASLAGGASKSGTRARLANLLDEDPDEYPGNGTPSENTETTYATLGNRSMRQFIDGPFSLFMGVLIILNAFLMFAQLEYDGCATAQSVGSLTKCPFSKASHEWFDGLEHFFNAIFASELALRIIVFRVDFFYRAYNLLDGLIVLTTVGRAYIIAPLAESGEVNVSYARLIRLTMMFRAFRVIRVLELFHTLRVLISTIASSFFCLFWSMIILFILQIVAALLLCQSLQEYILDESGDNNMRLWVNNYYGSSSKALYTMFEFTFSGCWPNYARPIVEEVHFAYAFLFILYVTAVVFAVTRIITALFLKDTMRIAQQDAEMMVQEKMREKLQVVDTLKEIFILADTSGDGLLSFSEFKSLVARPKIAAWLDVLGLDVKDVHTLFHLLDNGDGQIDAEEFVNGMMELKGFAREMDVIQIRHDTKRIMSKCDTIKDLCDSIHSPRSIRSDTHPASVGKRGSLRRTTWEDHDGNGAGVATAQPSAPRSSPLSGAPSFRFADDSLALLQPAGAARQESASGMLLAPSASQISLQPEPPTSANQKENTFMSEV